MKWKIKNFINGQRLIIETSRVLDKAMGEDVENEGIFKALSRLVDYYVFTFKTRNQHDEEWWD